MVWVFPCVPSVSVNSVVSSSASIDDAFKAGSMLAHLSHEVIKEIRGIVRTGARFGMILNGKNGQAAVPKTLERAVIEVEVGQFNVV